MSGGLDSLVSLGLKKEALNIKLALTFDYGQKSAKQEIDAARKICKHYDLKHEIIQLSWLKEITQTSLVSEKEIPTNEKLNNPQDSAMSVWVPNRNGLFLNIAGCYADSFDYDYIIIGANKEEGETFPDNTQEFLDGINQEFQFSTRKRPKVIAPLIKYMKNDIVKLALDNRIPLELTRSCYQSGEKHCGICESCSRLKKALKANNDTHYIEVLFK
jgi:7-cyano-7-deazaguanine synthase